MAVSPVLAFPFLRTIASSSVSLNACAPLSRSFSLGRSAAGQSLMVWYGAIIASPPGCFVGAVKIANGFSSTTLAGLVQYSQNEPLEIFTFRMMEAHRMIDWLAESFDHAYFTRRIDGCTEDDLLKEIDGKM